MSDCIFVYIIKEANLYNNLFEDLHYMIAEKPKYIYIINTLTTINDTVAISMIVHNISKECDENIIIHLMQSEPLIFENEHCIDYIIDNVNRIAISDKNDIKRCAIISNTDKSGIIYTIGKRDNDFDEKDLAFR